VVPPPLAVAAGGDSDVAAHVNASFAAMHAAAVRGGCVCGGLCLTTVQRNATAAALSSASASPIASAATRTAAAPASATVSPRAAQQMGILADRIEWLERELISARVCLSSAARGPRSDAEWQTSIQEREDRLSQQQNDLDEKVHGVERVVASQRSHQMGEMARLQHELQRATSDAQVPENAFVI
jgi:hypothetical protein